MRLDPRLLNETKSRRSALIFTLGLGAAGGLLTVLQARGLSQAIDQVFLKGDTLSDILGLLALLLLIIVVRSVIAWGEEVSAHAIAASVKHDLRERLFTHIAALGPAFTSGERTGELSNTAVEGIEALDAYFSQYLPQLALSALVPLTVLFFVFPLDIISGLVLLMTAPLIPIFMALIGSLAESLTRKQWLSLSRMSAYFLDVLQGLTTLKILGRSREQARMIARMSDRYRDVTMSVLRVTFLSALALELVATLSTALVAVEIGLRLLYGQLSFEHALFILILAPEFYLPLRLLGTRFHAGMSGFEAAQRIYAILETPVPSGDRRPQQADMEQISSAPFSRTKAHPATIQFHQEPIWLQGTTPATKQSPFEYISFEDVHFSYPDERAALNGVTFRILPGKINALVGPSGAGKSTIAGLLLRFFKPRSGQVYYGARFLHEISLEDWRKQVAWVPQNPYLFDDTLAANLRLARPQATFDQIVQAARQAGIDDFIRSLPEGYDTRIGEHALRLSGGQAQQLAIARAFLKDAPFIILDEATSNLDPESEDRLRESISRLAQDRTLLVIAHRLATVQSAGSIVVVDKGRVVECGSHVELMRADGLYRRLVHVWDYPEPGAALPGLKVELGPMTFSRGKPPLTTTAAQPPARRFSNLQVFLRLAALARPFIGLISLSALLGFATVGSGIGLMAASAYIISEAALHPSVAALQVAIVGVRFFGLTRGIFRYLERYTSHQVTFNLLARLRVWFYQALEPLAPARLSAYHSGDLINRLIGDIAALENFYVRGFAPPLAAVLVSLAMSIYMWGFEPGLAWALLGFMMLGGIGIPWLLGSLSREAGRQLVEARHILSVVLIDGIQGLPDLLAMNQEKRQLGLILRESLHLESARRRMAVFTGMQTALGSFVAYLGMLAILVLAVPLVSSERLPGIYLAVVTLAALACFEAVQPLPVAAQYLENSLQAARRLFEVVDATPSVTPPPVPQPVPSQFDLEIKNLDFSYPPSSERTSASIPDLWHLTLDHVSLPQGKRLALVGPTGSGKSTLVNLLLRFWDCQDGSILLAGRDVHCFDPQELRKRIAVVTQQAYLFNATLRENILLGRPEASQEAVEKAAREAHIHDFIHGLPQGYNTWVGEKGLLLSAGERQRVAIARALLKDAPFLILDEPTANLDTLNETLVLDALHTLMEDRTILMITHRLVGMEWMDEILVLQGGCIVERGAHSQLLEAHGLYRRMWDIQNQILG
jgi:ATP-binding cassette subfamily C protein CydCD